MFKTQYDPIGFICMVKNYFLTKLFYPSARIIRFPFYIRGRKFVKWGKGFTTGNGCRIEAYPVDKKSVVLHIGDNVQINDYVHITAMSNVVIGDNVLMASKIYISDNTHGSYCGDEKDSSPDVQPMEREYAIKGVNIGDNVWIGESVSILPGASIGKGCIVGSNSVVNKHIPPYSIAVGAPAIVVKKFNFDIKRWEKVQSSKTGV